VPNSACLMHSRRTVLTKRNHYLIALCNMHHLLAHTSTQWKTLPPVAGKSLPLELNTASAEKGPLPGIPGSATCIQTPAGSRSSAIQNGHHTSLRPSSLPDPRYPSLKVVDFTEMIATCFQEEQHNAVQCKRQRGHTMHSMHTSHKVAHVASKPLHNAN
jgi:hypothetical protein